MNIRKGDKVLIAKGRDKGKQGKVIKVLPKKNRAVLEGLNMVTKHIRPRRAGEKGKIIKAAAPIPISNLRLLCSNCNKGTRAGYVLKKGKKVRICKKCRKQI
jgi:large subunit ribosomal protein L24